MVVIPLAVLGLAMVKALFDHRTEYPWYHLAALRLRGDVAAERVLRQYHSRFVPEAYLVFPQASPPTAMRPLWAFRPSHAAPTYPVPVVEDTDGDGVPEVYIGSYSKQLYVRDGRDGHRLWDWTLPFGVIGGAAVALVDLDADGHKDVIFGTHWSLPIRVYALRTDPALSPTRRLKWVRNVSGDFIERGLSVFGEGRNTRIIAATRDAPYSRGTINVLDADGRPVYPPIRGVDVCASRCAIGMLPGSKGLSFLHGSHNFYGAQFGHQIVARELATGAILWQAHLGGDTGFQNHQIVDVDFDGRNEVVAFAAADLAEASKAVLLDGATGAIQREWPGRVTGILRKEQRILLLTKEENVICVDRNGTPLYTLPRPAFGVRLPDGSPRLVRFSYEAGTLSGEVYDGLSGKLLETYRAPLDIPPYEDPSVYGDFGAPEDELTFRTLADTDRDGFWNALLQFRDFIVDVHLPLPVHPGYDPNAPIAFRSINNSGSFYEPADAGRAPKAARGASR